MTRRFVILTDSVTKRRRDYWLGEYNTPESRECYHRLIAAWEANDRRHPEPEDAGIVPARVVTQVHQPACAADQANVPLGRITGVDSGIGAPDTRHGRGAQAWPDELLVMRGGDIEQREGKGDGMSVWVYRPIEHTNQFRSVECAIVLGPGAQEVIKPFLDGRDPEAYLFSPTEAAERH